MAFTASAFESSTSSGCRWVQAVNAPLISRDLRLNGFPLTNFNVESKAHKIGCCDILRFMH